MATFLTMGELAGLAIGTPEPGAVNFTVLKVLLQSLINKLALSDVQTEFDRKAIDDIRHRATDAATYKTLEPLREYSPRQKVEAIDEDSFAFDRPPRRGSLLSSEGYDRTPRRGSLLSSEDAQPMMNRARRSSTGMIRADEKARPLQFTKPLTSILSLRELEMKVMRLEENWSKMNQLRLLKQHHHQQQQPEQHHHEEAQHKEGSHDEIESFRPPMTVYEMWQSVQFEKKLDANTDGVNKLMSLTQDIIRKLQKLSESDAEQRQLIEQSHDKLRALASNSNFETIQQQLNFLSEMVQQLPPAGALNNFITWTGLESGLRGDDPLQMLNEAKYNGKRDSETDPQHVTKEKKFHESGKGHHQETKEKKPTERKIDPGNEPKEKKASDKWTDPQTETNKKKSSESRKSNPQPETKDKKSLGSKTDPQSEIVQRRSVEGDSQQATILPATKSSDSIGAESGGGSSIPLSGSGFVESIDAGSDVIRVDCLDGHPLLGLSPDFLNRLEALGKVNERFKTLESNMQKLELDLNEKADKKEATSVGALNDVANQIEAVNNELRIYKETRSELNALKEEMSRSKMPSMSYSQNILAASRKHSLGTIEIEAGTQDVSTETDEGGQQRKRSRSVAFDAIEQSMKIIDNTLAVLQRSVKDLDDKLKQEMESINQRLDATPVVAMEAETAASKDTDYEQERDRSADELGTRVAFLEKTMAEKQREMKKIQSQMKDLSTEVSNQVEEMMSNINKFVEKMENGINQRGIAASAQDDTMNVMYGVQNNVSDVNSEVEKLKHFTRELYESSKRQQNEIDAFRQLCDDLKRRVDHTEQELQANRNALEQKVDSHKFDETCEELSKLANTLLSRITLLDSEWRTTVEKLGNDLSNCFTKGEFDSLSENMIANIRELTKKLGRLQKQVDDVRFLGDDAAAVKRQLFSCLCCDRPVVMRTQSPRPSIPYREGLFSRRSTRPFTTYGLEQLRQNGKGFNRPQNMSNYERALFERHVTRSSIRDLRSDCANYWRSTKSSNLVKASSDDCEHHQLTNTPSLTQNLITNSPVVESQDTRNDQQVSETENVVSRRPLPALSESTVAHQGSLPSAAESSPSVGGVVRRSVTGFAVGDLSHPVKVPPPQTSTLKIGEEVESTRRRSSASSGGKPTSERKDSVPRSPPRNALLRRGTPAYMGFRLSDKIKSARPGALTIAENDESSRRRSSASSGGEQTNGKTSQPSLPARSVGRRESPVAKGIALPVKVATAARSAARSVALTIAEEDDSSRRRSTEFSAKEDLDDSRKSFPNDPNSDEVVAISALRSLNSSHKAIPEDEEPPQDLSEDEQEDNS